MLTYTLKGGTSQDEGRGTDQLETVVGGTNQDVERKVIRLGELTSWEPQREGQVTGQDTNTDTERK